MLATTHGESRDGALILDGSLRRLQSDCIDLTTPMKTT